MEIMHRRHREKIDTGEKNRDKMKKLKKESIRQEQKKHVLQQIEICLKRMLVTTGASCSVIVSEGFKAELDETFDHD